MSQVTNPTTPIVDEECVSLLTFEVGGLAVALDVRLMYEINRQAQIEPIPHAPSALAGVINLRGQVLTVIDVASLLGAAPTTRRGKLQFLIVAAPDGECLGLLIDRVVDVFPASFKNLTAKPEQVAGPQARFFSHVVPRNDDLLLVLDLAKVVSHVDETIATMTSSTSS